MENEKKVMMIGRHVFLSTMGAALGIFAGKKIAGKMKKKKVEKGGDVPVFGIICALDKEADPLKEEMLIENIETHSGLMFYQGELKGQRVVIVRCGVGKVNAALCTEALCTVYKVDYLINTGVAGTLMPGIDQGDIVVSTDAVQHDFDVTALGDPLGEIANMGITYFPADEKLIALVKTAAAQVDLGNHTLYEGRVASGDQFIAGGERAAVIKENFDPSAVEMEGAAIAHTAYVNAVPFVIIRSISDKADGDVELSYNEFLPLAAANASHLVKAMLESASEIV